jgi:catechol 2,3-dioxygenase-like lactoylglutathione lyase family enzyme
MAITGVHAILHTADAGADRAFLADVLGLESVDAGAGWLIFALPPAELAAHPASADGGGYELYLMCDDIEATVRELKAKGVEFSDGVTEQRWGLVTTIILPGGGRLGLYEPRHASPLRPTG